MKGDFVPSSPNPVVTATTNAQKIPLAPARPGSINHSDGVYRRNTTLS